MGWQARTGAGSPPGFSDELRKRQFLRAQQALHPVQAVQALRAVQAVQARQEAARGARRKNVCELHWRAVGHTHGAAADLQLRLPPRFLRNSPFFVVLTRNNDLSVLQLSTNRELSERTKLLLLQVWTTKALCAE